MIRQVVSSFAVATALGGLYACGGSSATSSPDGSADQAAEAGGDSAGVTDAGAPDAPVLDGKVGSDGTGGCAAIGASCASKEQCCSNYCKAGTCACNSAGYTCLADVDCCNGLVCGPQGTCVTNPAAPYLALCQPCELADASPEACGSDAFCVDVGTAAGGPAGFCAPSCGEGTTGECPPDFTCESLAALEQGPPGAVACIPNSRTCNSPDGGIGYCAVTCDPTLLPTCPCSGDVCTATSLGYVCLSSYAPTAALCQSCAASTDCPAGYSCVPEPADAGISGSFCAPFCTGLTCPSPTYCDDDNPEAVSVCYPPGGSCADGG